MAKTEHGHWLDSTRAALDHARGRVTFFFRDDDVGWRSDRLRPLCDLLAEYSLPLDLAVIPQALDPAYALELAGLVESAPDRFGVHQHGFAHANHEPSGRKQEFGPARGHTAQRDDIEAGRQRLHDLLGPIVEPIFTPPWNRCTAVTGECLVELGFDILSREARAEPLGVEGLRELPVSVDWFAKRKGVRLPRAELGDLIAARIRDGRPVGVMFHHALMDSEELRAAGELAALVAGHERTRCRQMLALGRE